MLGAGRETTLELKEDQIKKARKEIREILRTNSYINSDKMRERLYNRAKLLVDKIEHIQNNDTNNKISEVQHEELGE